MDNRPISNLEPLPPLLKLCQIVDILIDLDSPKSKRPEKVKTISTGLQLASELSKPSSEMALLTKIAQYNRDSIEDFAAEKNFTMKFLFFPGHLDLVQPTSVKKF